MRKVIAVIVGFIIGAFVSFHFGLMIGSLFEGYEYSSENFLYSTRDIIEFGMMLVVFFISSIIAGYIARDRGKLIGLLSASPISVGALLVLIRAIVIKDINTSLGEILLILFFMIGIILLPYFGGGFGESLAVRKQGRNRKIS